MMVAVPLVTASPIPPAGPTLPPYLRQCVKGHPTLEPQRWFGDIAERAKEIRTQALHLKQAFVFSRFNDTTHVDDVFRERHHYSHFPKRPSTQPMALQGQHQVNQALNQSLYLLAVYIHHLERVETQENQFQQGQFSQQINSLAIEMKDAAYGINVMLCERGQGLSAAVYQDVTELGMDVTSARHRHARLLFVIDDVIHVGGFIFRTFLGLECLSGLHMDTYQMGPFQDWE
ncbi:uncharacterized protein LOC135491415 [Lineus longissimus]|uniref:uncharacterized protein LOC135491415 n=1 Tax=Lineus longissimus TaxID=88925 RepID=UPI002B4F39D5